MAAEGQSSSNCQGSAKSILQQLQHCVKDPQEAEQAARQMEERRQRHLEALIQEMKGVLRGHEFREKTWELNLN